MAVPVCPLKVTADSVKIMLSVFRSQHTLISNQKMSKEVKASGNHSSITNKHLTISVYIQRRMLKCIELRAVSYTLQSMLKKRKRNVCSQVAFTNSDGCCIQTFFLQYIS